MFFPYVDWTCHSKSYVFFTMEWPCMNNVYMEAMPLCLPLDWTKFMATKTIWGRVLWFKVQTCEVSSRQINWSNEIHIYNINSIIHHSCKTLNASIQYWITNVQCVKKRWENVHSNCDKDQNITSISGMNSRD
jgi:hypothetical protein